MPSSCKLSFYFQNTYRLVQVFVYCLTRKLSLPKSNFCYETVFLFCFVLFLFCFCNYCEKSPLNKYFIILCNILIFTLDYSDLISLQRKKISFLKNDRFLPVFIQYQHKQQNLLTIWKGQNGALFTSVKIKLKKNMCHEKSDNEKK